MDTKTLELRKRFVSDFNLPIPVIDDNYFEYFLDLYEDMYKSKTKYDTVIDTIKNQFNNNISKFLEYYGIVRNNIIEDLNNSDKFKKFNTSDMSIYNICLNVDSGKNVYNKTNKNKKFLSIDLSKANFQALKFVGVISDNTYNDFISNYTNLNYIKDSKYTRQVIFGKLNPSRQIKVEKFIISNIYYILRDWLSQKNIHFNLEVLAVDELVISLSEFLDEIDLIKLQYFIVNTFKEKFKFDVSTKMDQFELDIKTFKTYNDISFNAYLKKDIVDNNYVIKGVSCNYFAQVYKLLNGLNISENDMVFYQDKQLAKYIYPLTITEQ